MADINTVAHTPGPWHNEKPQPHSRSASAVICGAPPSCVPHIAYIPTNGYAASLDEQAANARLIAATPELLTALRQIAQRDHVRDAEERPPMVVALERWNECVAIAKAAIAKAEGR